MASNVINKLKQEIESLKNAVAQHESRLECFNIKLSDETKKNLDDCTEFQLNSGLQDLDVMFLREYYLLKKREHVENNIAKTKLQIEVDTLRNEIEEETKQCTTLEKFINEAKTIQDETTSASALLDTEIRSLQQKQQQIILPEDLDIDELMKKIDLLKHQQTGGKSNK